MKRIAFTCTCCLLMSMGFMSCDDDQRLPEDPGYDLGEKQPTEDQMSVLASGSYQLYGNPGSGDLLNAVLNRFAASGLPAPGASNTVLIMGNQIPELSEADLKNILQLFLNGDAMVVSGPTAQSWNALAKGLADAYTTMLKEMSLPASSSDEAQTFLDGLLRDLHVGNKAKIYGLPVAVTDENSMSHVFTDLLAVRGNEVRTYAENTQAGKSPLQKEIYKYDNYNKLISSTTSEEAIMPQAAVQTNGFERGQMADNLVSWLNKGKSSRPEKPSAGDAPTDLKDLMNAQIFTNVYWSDNSDANYKKWNYRRCQVETTYFIWALYDFDHDRDYYLIHQEFTLHHGQLGCTTSKKGWDCIDGDNCYLGSWGYDTTNTIQLLDSEGKPFNTGVTMMDVEPTTHGGSSSYSSGMSWNLSGNIGLTTQGPSGGLGGGVSFSESYTTTVPDYSAELKSEGSKANWFYKAGNARIKGHFAWDANDADHDVIPACYRDDITFHQSWKYSIEHPQKNYKLDTVHNHGIIWYEGTDTWWYMTDTFYHQHNEKHYVFDINPPVRFKNSWYMNIEVPEGMNQEKVRKFMIEHYTKFWSESFTNYGFSATDYSGIDIMMNKFKSDILNDLGSWTAAGFKGKYKINVHPSTSSTVYASFDFTVD